MPYEEDLIKAMMNKISGILTSGDEHAPVPESNYITWCQPGIPFQAEDLQFAVKGMSGTNGEETRQLIRTASDFSRSVNLIPNSHAFSGDEQRDVYEQNGSVLWDIYKEVLDYSQVAGGGLTDDEKAKIKKFRNLMVNTKKVKDIVTDEEKEVTEDSPMMKAYKEKSAIYDEAVQEYNQKRLAAMNSDNSQAVQDFSLNASSYRRRVKQAMDDWETNGYKEDVEKIQAYIKQVSQKDLTLLKADLQDKFEKSKQTDPNSNSDFYLSSFYPGNFVNNDKGWTQFSFSHENMETYSKEVHTSVSAEGKGIYGLWIYGGGGGYSKDKSTESMKFENFEMKFSLTQVSLSRPWFSPEFVLNTAWRFKPGMGFDALSNGNSPLKGRLIAYPTSAVFIKDITISSSDMSSFHEAISKSLNVGLSVGWGPFRIGGNYKKSSKEEETKYSLDGNTLNVEGMQLLAFKCFPMPKAPNPSPDIENWV
jgi:hypothetical protein